MKYAVETKVKNSTNDMHNTETRYKNGKVRKHDKNTLQSYTWIVTCIIYWEKIVSKIMLISKVMLIVFLIFFSIFMNINPFVL